MDRTGTGQTDPHLPPSHAHCCFETDMVFHSLFGLTGLWRHAAVLAQQAAGLVRQQQTAAHPTLTCPHLPPPFPHPPPPPCPAPTPFPASIISSPRHFAFPFPFTPCLAHIVHFAMPCATHTHIPSPFTLPPHMPASLYPISLSSPPHMPLSMLKCWLRAARMCHVRQLRFVCFAFPAAMTYMLLWAGMRQDRLTSENRRKEGQKRHFAEDSGTVPHAHTYLCMGPWDSSILGFAHCVVLVLNNLLNNTVKQTPVLIPFYFMPFLPAGLSHSSNCYPLTLPFTYPTPHCFLPAFCLSFCRNICLLHAFCL